ncbi:HEPN domain-containing protein [Dickeya fangzhongdai]|uniref:RiboL-PSP-HEPN domain-containing protein n=1 Tax=Dickeya fangzhongdai TaxID=1778540 RepID=A0A2K8QHW6_9GAMM|nr:HEPN domain-containing protein [Dickeya fangzhongdai]ATZ93061.1 hypothetical protein CVE23_03165 [Dickeya fangzhongdai]QOH46491.1 hypothetical protein DYD82_03200 [Dickeya fangzhongdai]QOH50797.1 hypothetical protein DYD83_03200 [Dickeya fangzhongdai]GGB97903.1 hypothetical protein GCM10007171_13760 [Dickeya fangzhongdai]
MSTTKDDMMTLEEARLAAWMAEQYPDLEPDSAEWEQAAQLHFWEQDARAAQAQWDHEHDLFVVSLDDVQQRYRHAMQELRKLYALLDDPQPEIVYRMAVVHAVTVMEAYLMYCARALLEHDWPLRRFFDEYFVPFANVDKKEKQAAREMSLSLFRSVARKYVASSMTFHNVKTIKRYFGAVLHIPPVWPIEPLGIIADWRNDLVHRNGVDKQDVPLDISPHQLQNALQKVCALIEAADIAMQQEIDLFGNGRTEENREIMASALNITLSGDASS